MVVDLRHPKWSVSLVLTVCLALWPYEAPAQSAFKLGLPVDCTIGETCWLVNLVDLDPSPGVKDYRCASQTYDTHKGTDIAIRDVSIMKAGVPILASAPGVVRAVRDGMADRDASVSEENSVKGVECGNGLVVDHADGWQTQYCHLRKDSLIVKQGDRIEKGQKLGLVGHSGKAAFPHLHLSVRRHNQVVDPFVGEKRAGSCGLGENALWDDNLIEALSGTVTTIFNADFAPVPPKFSGILAGLYHDKALSRQAPALILWGVIYQIEKGDEVAMRIISPEGEVIHDYANTIEKTQARRWLYSGKKRTTRFWPEGLYTGEISIHRISKDGSQLVSKVEREILVR